MKRLFPRCCLLLGGVAIACNIAACNGELTVLSQPVEVASGSNGNVPAPDALASCPELELQPVLPNETFPQLIGCGHCRCSDGAVSCEERNCPSAQTLRLCPEHSELTPDAISTRAQIIGDTLYLDAKGYGGCGDVDLMPCYVDPSQSTLGSQTMYPKRATIRVLNFTSAADCPKVVFQHLEIGLRTLVNFESEAGGLVDTPFGLAQVGERSCFDTATFAADQAFRALLRQQPNSESFAQCTNDADCAAVANGGCGSCASVPANVATYEAMRPELERIEREICAPRAGECGDVFVGYGGCQPPSIGCRNGTCTRLL